MEQSLQVLEWMAEGEAKDAARKLLRLLELRFGAVPAELEEKIRATADLAKLDRWFDAAVPAKTLKQVRSVIGV